MSDAAAPAAPPTAPAEATAPEQAEIAQHERETPERPDRPTKKEPPAEAKDKKEPPKAPPPEKRKYKVKDGDIEEEVDEDEVVRGYQRAKAAYRRMEEAANEKKEATRLRNEAQNLFRLLKENPLAALTHEAVGHDPRALAQYLWQQSQQEEQLTPAERELRALKQHLQQEQMTRQQQEEAARAQAEQQAQMEYTQRLERELDNVFERTSLPPTAAIASRLLYAKDRALDFDHDAPFEELLPLVESGYQREYQEYLGSFEGEDLIRRLGEDVATKVQKAMLDRYRKANPVKRTAPKKQDTDKKPDFKRMNFDQAFDYIVNKGKK